MYICSMLIVLDTASLHFAATSAEGAWVSTKKMDWPFTVQSPPPLPPRGSLRIATPFASKRVSSSSKILCSFITRIGYRVSANPAYHGSRKNVLKVDIDTKARDQFYSRSRELASVIERRTSLHKQLQEQQRENTALKSQIGRLQSLANIGTATCMIAHEINNLLTPSANYAALALKNPDDKALTEKALQKAMRNCEQASKIMESMLAVANGETKEKKEVPLTALVEDVFQCLCRDFAKDGITVNLKISEDLKIWAVPVLIQQVLMNLILNAREAMLGGGGVLTIEAQTTIDAIEIEVRDTGCGIAADDLENIFEPFFTTKENKKPQSQRSSSGLGLAFCKQVVEEHGGCISVESEPAKGTSFKIILPKR